MKSRKLTLKALMAAAILVGCGAATFGAELAPTPEHDYQVPQPGTYRLPVIKPGANGELVESTGQSVELHDLTHGRITVMSFIYTRCASAKACPYATGVLLRLHRISAQDPVLARQLRLVSLSFDPVNDTPERMAAYAKLAAGASGAAEWRFVTTASQEKLTPILEAYGQAVDKKSDPTDPTGPLNHTLRVFLLDTRGNIRNIYSSGTLDVRLVLADVKTLALEEEQQVHAANRSGALSSPTVH